MIKRGFYEYTFDGRTILHFDPKELELSRSEIEAFNQILLKGSRIHAFFAMKDEDMLDLDKVCEDKEVSEFQDET